MIEFKGSYVSFFLNPLSNDGVDKIIEDVEKLFDDIENHPEMFDEGFSISL